MNLDPDITSFQWVCTVCKTSRGFTVDDMRQAREIAKQATPELYCLHCNTNTPATNLAALLDAWDRERRRPDEDRDVVLHRFREIDVSAPEQKSTEKWTLWLGPERQAEFLNESQAIEAARQLSREVGRPAWIHDAGYPLKPITEN